MEIKAIKKLVKDYSQKRKELSSVLYSYWFEQGKPNYEAIRDNDYMRYISEPIGAQAGIKHLYEEVIAQHNQIKELGLDELYSDLLANNDLIHIAGGQLKKHYLFEEKSLNLAMASIQEVMGKEESDKDRRQYTMSYLKGLSNNLKGLVRFGSISDSEVFKHGNLPMKVISNDIVKGPKILLDKSIQIVFDKNFSDESIDINQLNGLSKYIKEKSEEVRRKYNQGVSKLNVTVDNIPYDVYLEKEDGGGVVAYLQVGSMRIYLA